MRLPSKSGLFLILMGVSLVTGFILPKRWTEAGRAPFQTRALLQRVFTGTAQEASQRVAEVVEEPRQRRRAAELAAENEALRRQVVAQGLRLRQQQLQLDELTGLVGQSPDNLATIVRAPVVAFDADGDRETVQVMLPSRAYQYVEVGHWVAAGVREKPSRELISRAALVGQVTEVQTRLARVRLASDPGFNVGVRVAKVLPDGNWRVYDEPCRLLGKGGGRMLIDLAEQNYYAEQARVVVVPGDDRLPWPLSVGEIVGAEPRRDSPQHVDLVVQPWVELSEMTHAYIIVPSD